MKIPPRETHVGEPTTGKYILKGRRVVPCADLIEWGTWMEQRDIRKVARTTLSKGGIGFDLSTVFLGLDHRTGKEKGRPMVFETMAFGGPDDGEQRRCCTFTEAEQQHLNLLDSYTAKGWKIEP